MLEKVAAFIIRTGKTGPELLVFRPQVGGLQIPGGSIEPGETPVEAAHREVAEETGLTGLRFERILGAPAGPPPNDLYALLEPVEMQVSGSNERLAAGIGWLVSVIGEEGEDVRVMYQERDWNGSRERVVREAVGRVKRSALTRWIVRHLVLLRCDRLQPDEWDWQSRGDAGGVYHCFWMPLAAGEERDWRLPEGAHLIGEQDAWMAYLRGVDL